MVLTIPSSSAYAPNRITMPASVMPGHANVTIPRMTPSTPRSTSDHQLCINATLITSFLAPLGGLVGRAGARCAGSLRTLRALRLLNRDLPLPALLLLDRNLDLQHAILIARVRLIGLHALRQWDRPVEMAVASFGGMNAAAILLALELAFALQDHLVVVH